MMERFVHGRVIFAGDAAHVVSPFGARGGNAAVADADNLAWKLALVIAGKSPASLLDSYCSERRAAARENILQFDPQHRLHHAQVRGLARFSATPRCRWRGTFPFARALINSGRLSVPTAQAGSPLDTPDVDDDWSGGPAPGRAMVDAPLGQRLAGRPAGAAISPC